MTQMTPAQTAQRCAAVLEELERAIVGKRAALELVLPGILAGGHILLEDLPGLGKTLTARSFARVLGLEFTRIQFTPDLLPSDVTGAPYDQRHRGVRCSGRAGVHPAAAGRRDQPDPAQDPGGTAGGDGRGPGHRRRRDPAAADPFVVLATAQPDRVRGDLPAARSPARPVPAAAPARLPGRRGRGRRCCSGGWTGPPTWPAEPASATRAGCSPCARSLEQVEVSPDLLDVRRRADRCDPVDPQIQVGASPRGGLFLVQLARARAVCGPRLRHPRGRQGGRGAGPRAPGHLKPELWVGEGEPEKT